MTTPVADRILLIGFMGSGKSTVGRLLARGLRWRFVDADRQVEEREGRGVPELFRELGEEGFRRAEHRAMQELLGESGVVIASGGGWPCREDRWEGLDQRTLTIWLRASPEGILQRVAEDGEVERPLLQVADPPRRVEELLRARTPWYARAEWTVDTDGLSPDEVSGVILERLQQGFERPLRA